MQFQVFEEIKPWKKPIHAAFNWTAKIYLETLLSNLEIIGITGSVGKTLTQNAVYSVLSQKFRTKVGDENLDPTFRIPQTILSSSFWHQKLVLEYGVEHPNDMDFYLKIAKPKIAVVTAVSPTHLKYFKDEEGVFEEKVKLVKSLKKEGVAILNADDPSVAKMANFTKAKVRFFGKNAQNGIKISHFAQNLKGSRFRLHYKGQKAAVDWKIIGEHHLLSAYAAAAVGLQSGLTLKQIAKGLSQTKPPAHRLNSIAAKNYSIIDDTYNASPKAMIESITTLVELGNGKQKVAVLGEMKDLGNLSRKSHEEVGKALAKSRINYLITVGKTAGIIGSSAQNSNFKGKSANVADPKSAVDEIKKIKSKNLLILVKGSRHAHLERVVYLLQSKPANIKCYHCPHLK